MKYNNENSLACVLTIAYYAAKKDYQIVRELPTGKGFADIVLLPRPNRNLPAVQHAVLRPQDLLLPRPNRNLPAVVLELKYDHTAETAINQIKGKRYTDSLLDYVGEVVLVGVNYDKESKKHQCVIEKDTKN